MLIVFSACWTIVPVGTDERSVCSWWTEVSCWTLITLSLRYYWIWVGVWTSRARILFVMHSSTWTIIPWSASNSHYWWACAASASWTCRSLRTWNTLLCLVKVVSASWTSNLIDCSRWTCQFLGIFAAKRWQMTILNGRLSLVLIVNETENWAEIVLGTEYAVCLKLFSLWRIVSTRRAKHWQNWSKRTILAFGTYSASGLSFLRLIWSSRARYLLVIFHRSERTNVSWKTQNWIGNTFGTVRASHAILATCRTLNTIQRLVCACRTRELSGSCSSLGTIISWFTECFIAITTLTEISCITNRASLVSINCSGHVCCIIASRASPHTKNWRPLINLIAPVTTWASNNSTALRISFPKDA